MTRVTQRHRETVHRLGEVVTTTKTIVKEENNTTFYLDGTVGAVVTLPAALVGLSFKFVISSLFITSNWAITSAEGSNIEGSVEVNDVGVDAVNENEINFAFGAESVGDFIDIHSDGTSWFVNGRAMLAGGITAT